MKRWLVGLALLLTSTAVFAQDANLEGSWQVYQMTEISRYSLKEHLNPQSVLTGGTMTLNSDGTITINVPNLTVTSWSTDEGFLMFITPNGNLFYWPRVLSQNIYYLVQVDVTELNEEIIYLRSNPRGTSS